MSQQTIFTLVISSWSIQRMLLDRTYLFVKELVSDLFGSSVRVHILLFSEEKVKTVDNVPIKIAMFRFITNSGV